jgi:antitoxin component of MazEF toxin-antitoxin module
MIYTVEVCKTEDGIGVPLPPEVLKHLGVAEGDELEVTFSNGEFHARAHREKSDSPK